jgi:hypothetical protein
VTATIVEPGNLLPNEEEDKEALERGIEYCRQGQWEQGLSRLGRLAEKKQTVEMPGLFYSYLGYGIALCQKRFREGLRLCEHSVKVEFFEPENYFNLARTYLLVNNRRGAHKAVVGGLSVDPSHRGLRKLRKSLGRRRPPVIRALSRSHPVNRFLGSLRYIFIRS